MRPEKKKIKAVESSNQAVDKIDRILAREQEIVTAKVNPDVVDQLDDLFRFAVDRHSRRATPDLEKFRSVYPLKGYQEEGLGWLLDREGFEAPRERITPVDWVTNVEDGTWTNVVTGVTVSERPVSGYTGGGGRQEVLNTVRGGILADEMGLGKTVQMIALIATHRKPGGSRPEQTKATLVVVPPVLLGTWKSELEKWAPGLRVYMHHGDGRTKRDLSPLLQHDVVVTTYDTLKMPRDIDLFTRLAWWRVILDEGHKIKNPVTGVSQAVHRIEAPHRWIISGTPIQNTWRDLFSLMKFLRVRPYGEIQGWYRLIEEPLTSPGSSPYRAEALQNLRNLIQVLVLRRTKRPWDKRSGRVDPIFQPGLVVRRPGKKDGWEVQEKRLDRFVAKNLSTKEEFAFPYVRNGEPTYEFIRELVHIPEKQTQEIRLPFASEWERQIYNRLVEEGMVKDRDVGNSLVYLLRMRQAVIHPWLLEPQKLRARIDRVIETRGESWKPSTKITWLLRDLRETKRGGRRESEKSLVFSQYTGALDLVELALETDGANADERWLAEEVFQDEWRKYKARYARVPRDQRPTFRYRNNPRYVRIDGKSSYAEREQAMESLRTEPNVKLALLSLHATGVGLTLTSANNVYFLDLFFNPQVHLQAIDRTHRIGQDKVVQVKTLVIADTIEEKLLKLLDYKKGISEFTLKPVQIQVDRILSLLQ